MARARSTQRYFSEDDSEVGVTRSQLKRLGRARQLEYMAYWFNSMFEDPSNDTPYNSGEGGFLYIWGGPYDANDQLSGEFGGIVPDERIEEAVELVQEDGIYDWAPGPGHPDRVNAENELYMDELPDEEPDVLQALIERLKAGTPAHLGDAAELEQRQAVIARLDALRVVLDAAAPTHGGIGHNNPPPDDETEGPEIAEMRRLETTIRTELQKTQPEAVVVAQSASRLRAIAGWAGKKLDTATDAFAKAVGDGLGKATVAGALVLGGLLIPGAGDTVRAVVGQVVTWLTHITLPL